MTRYIIDTSAFSALTQHNSRRSICNFLISLIKEGKIVVIKRVYGEIKHVAPDVYDNLVKIRKFVSDKDTDAVWAEAGRITYHYRHMSRPSFTQRQIADPWILAHAKIHQYTVVTNEGRKRNRQMPDVCDREGIPVITLDELWSLHFSK